MNKLEGLPTIHYISLEESLDRRTNLENWFQKYNITNYVPHLFKRFEKYNHNLIGTNVHLLAEHSKGPITSHLRLLRELYETYDDEYFLIVEDDLSLETVEHWNFTWKQFYQNLPKDWNGIQLTIVREYNVKAYSFEERRDKDWCVAGYLIKRNYAKYLLDLYYFDTDFNLNTSFIPVVEDVLFFHTNPNIYCFPLFVEDFYNAKSTYRNPELVDDCHHKSYHNVLNWWENKGKNLTINQIMNTQLNHIYQESQFGENWFSYPNLYRKMVEKFPSGSKFVEIGSWKGKSSAFMAVEIANSNKNIEFYCVDTWEGSVEHQDRDDLKSLYDTFNQNMMPLKDYHIPLKMISLEAVEKFEDKSLDFVFIDASHEYEDVKKDIISWLPKVKEGGIIAGHDYYLNGTDFFPGVKQAVNETLKSNELEFAEDCWIYQVKLVSNELIEYSLDTENAKKNYNLAKWYESQGHTAPAHSYYLRAAERSEDNLLAYSALIRGSFCYGAQKSRDSSEKVLLENALVLLPKRPEAFTPRHSPPPPAPPAPSPPSDPHRYPPRTHSPRHQTPPPAHSSTHGQTPQTLSHPAPPAAHSPHADNKNASPPCSSHSPPCPRCSNRSSHPPPGAARACHAPHTQCASQTPSPPPPAHPPPRHHPCPSNATHPAPPSHTPSHHDKESPPQSPSPHY